MSRYDWHDQWVLVTGASSGIGREFALQLAARGANLVLCSRNEQRLNALADELGTQVRVVSGDLQTSDGVDALLERLDALDVRIDHVVNNAGMGGAGPFVDQSAKWHTDLVALNCSSVLRLTHHFVPKFVERGGGGFIQVASTAAFQPVPFMAVYGASKAFVLHMSVALAEELRGSGVRVMALCPGSVPTEFQERAGYKLTGLQAKNHMTADKVVASGLDAYERGQWTYIPGVTNSVQTFLQRFVSLKTRTRAAGFVMKRSGRDKFGPA